MHKFHVIIDVNILLNLNILLFVIARDSKAISGGIARPMSGLSIALGSEIPTVFDLGMTPAGFNGR